MNRIGRYLVRTILGFTAITAVALVAIYTLISFVAEIDETERGFSMLQLLWYTLLMLPAGLQVLLPIIALLGTLMGLGALAAQNELTAMRAGGVTLLRIGMATVVAGALLGAFAVVLSDWLAPMSTLQARAFKAQTRYAADGGVTAQPVWLRDGHSIVHIRALSDERTLAQVDIFMLHDDLTVDRIIHAQSARFEDAAWVLRGVRATQFDDGHTQAQSYEQLRWDGHLSPEVLRLYVLEANSVSAPGLLRLIRYLDANGLDARQYELAFWRKLIAPLTVIMMMVFAVPFVLGSQRGGGAGQRLLIGILVGLGFHVTNEVVANLGQLYAWPSALAAGLPTVALAMVALWRLQRAR